MKVWLQLFSILVFTLVINFAKAQNRIGYINTQKLIASMPEADAADSILKAYQIELAYKGQELEKRADSIAEHFICDDCEPPPDSVKNKQRGLVIALYQAAQNWQQTAQGLYNKRAEELITPIRKKAMDAIEAVAKEKQYDIVLDASIDTLLLSPVKDDLLNIVRQKLGIPLETVTEKEINENAIPGKTGYINMVALLNSMPETAVTDSAFKLFTDRLSNYKNDTISDAKRFEDSLAFYNRRLDELKFPVYAKALAAVIAIARQNRYSYVINTDEKMLPVKPAEDDLLDKVKARLGINTLPGK